MCFTYLEYNNTLWIMLTILALYVQLWCPFHLPFCMLHTLLYRIFYIIFIKPQYKTNKLPFKKGWTIYRITQAFVLETLLLGSVHMGSVVVLSKVMNWLAHTQRSAFPNAISRIFPVKNWEKYRLKRSGTSPYCHGLANSGSALQSRLVLSRSKRDRERRPLINVD